MTGSWTRFHILRVLAEGPSYPYQLAKDVASSTSGRVTLEAGNLHRRLQQLVAEGLIEETAPPDGSAPGDRRRYFGLTAKGQRQLTDEVEQMRDAMRLVKAGTPDPLP